MANKKLNSIKFPGLNDTYTIPDAQVNSDWNASTGVSSILNKPTIPAAQVNANWNATTGVASILNKPTIPSTYTDVGAASAAHTHTAADVGALSSNTVYVSTVNGQSGAITIEEPLVIEGTLTFTLSSTSGSGTFTPTSGDVTKIPTANEVYIKADIHSFSMLSSDYVWLRKMRKASTGMGIVMFNGVFDTAGGTVYIEVEGEPDDEGDWHYAIWSVTYRILQQKLTSYVSSVNGASGQVTLTAANVGAVPTSRTVNGKTLSSNITLTAADVGALPSTTAIPSNTSDLTNDSNFATTSYVDSAVASISFPENVKVITATLSSTDFDSETYEIGYGATVFATNCSNDQWDNYVASDAPIILSIIGSYDGYDHKHVYLYKDGWFRSIQGSEYWYINKTGSGGDPLRLGYTLGHNYVTDSDLRWSYVPVQYHNPDSNVNQTIYNHGDYDFGLTASGSDGISQICVRPNEIIINSSDNSAHIGLDNPSWTPTYGTDFTTKSYVDTAVASISIPEEIFWVNVTATSPYTADQTYSAISNAIDNGQMVYVNQGGCIYALSDDDRTTGTGSISFEYIAYAENTGGTKWLSFRKLTIASDNTVSRISSMKNWAVNFPGALGTQGQIITANAAGNMQWSNMPAIPSTVSQLTNDAGYLTLATLPIYDGSVS